MTEHLQRQIDELRADVRNLAQALQSLRLEMAEQITLVAQQQPVATDFPPDVQALYERSDMSPARQLAEKARQQGKKGLITNYGFYDSGGRGYFWNFTEVSAEELLAQDIGQVAHVLSAISHRQRLAMLKSILEQPATAAELTEKLGMGTTGQVYHHLKVLQAANLVDQGEHGQYTFVGHRASGFLMLLSGVRDLLDARYSSGAWEEQSQAE